MMEENGLEIVRAFDTLYGFILSQEVHVRAELFQNLDVLYHWARKASAGAVNGSSEQASKPEDASTVSSGSASDTSSSSTFRDEGWKEHPQDESQSERTKTE